MVLILFERHQLFTQFLSIFGINLLSSRRNLSHSRAIPHVYQECKPNSRDPINARLSGRYLIKCKFDSNYNLFELQGFDKLASLQANHYSEMLWLHLILSCHSIKQWGGEHEGKAGGGLYTVVENTNNFAALNVYFT